jgi:hypothetical protein
LYNVEIEIDLKFGWLMFFNLSISAFEITGF